MPYKKARTIGSWRVDPPNERSLKVLLTPQMDEGCPDATFLLSTILPHGGQTGVHTHDVDEVIYIISGYGTGEEAGQTFDIEPGVLIHAKAGVEHNCTNLGDETMQLFCAFIPALPETTVKRIVDNSVVRLTE